MNLMSSFESDGASVMTGQNAGVAARLKNLQPTIISFHCICNNFALSKSDADPYLKPVKNTVTNLQLHGNSLRTVLNAQLSSFICRKNYAN